MIWRRFLCLVGNFVYVGTILLKKKKKKKNVGNRFIRCDIPKVQKAQCLSKDKKTIKEKN